MTGFMKAHLLFVDWITGNVVERGFDTLNKVTGGLLESLVREAWGLFATVVSWLLSLMLGDKGLINEGWVQITFSIQRNLTTVAILFVTLGVAWQALRMIWNKNAQPLADLLRAVGIFLFVSITGIALVQGASLASDELAAQFLRSDLQIEVAEEGITGSEGVSTIGALAGAQTLTLAFGLGFLVVAVIALFILYIFILLKDIAVVIASGTLVLAASGQFFRFSTEWLDKVIGSLVGLLLYKPAVALLMNVALNMMASGGLVGLLAGPVLLITAGLMFKPLLKYFTGLTFTGGIGQGGSFGSGAVVSGGRGGVPQGAG